MNSFIRFLYALLVAGALIAFAGLAIYSFYQPPKQPDYPTYDYSNGYSSTALQRRENAYDRAQSRYDSDSKKYQKHVTYILLPAALVSAVAGLYLIRKRLSDVIGEGLALGGVGIAIYAIIEASMADARILRFVSVSLLLLVALLLAYFRFSPERVKAAVAVSGGKPDKLKESKDSSSSIYGDH